MFSSVSVRNVTQITNTNFGIIISYVIPGLILLVGIELTPIFRQVTVRIKM